MPTLPPAAPLPGHPAPLPWAWVGLPLFLLRPGLRDQRELAASAPARMAPQTLIPQVGLLRGLWLRAGSPNAAGASLGRPRAPFGVPRLARPCWGGSRVGLTGIQLMCLWGELTLGETL